MDRRLSTPPAKKFRGLSDLNMPMLECKREFPLPHKFPSINNSLMRNFKIKNYGTVTICKPETLVSLNGVKNKKEVITNGMKKLRIKTIDGKDLGEVKVQFLTKKNIINTEKTIIEQSGNHRRTNLTNLSVASANATSGPLNSSLLQSALEKSQNSIVKAQNTIGSKSKLYSKSTSANKLGVACKKSLPMQEKTKSVSQKLVVPKSNHTNESKMILVQKETASKAKESDIPKKVENCKTQAAKSWVSVANYEKLSILKKKDAINGIAASSAAATKSKPSSGSELRCNESPKRIVKPFKLVCNSRANVPPPSTKISRRSTSPLKKPKDEEISDGENDVVIVCERNPSSTQYCNNSQEKGGVSLSANNETVNNACTEIRNKSDCCEEGNGVAAVKEIAKDVRLLDCLNVIKEALTSVTDEELRAKALCALAECRISKAKEIPITPPEILKTVHDTQIQTDVFALLEANSFVLVKGDSPGLQRITQTERSSVVPPPVLLDVQTQTEPQTQTQTQPMVRLNHCIDNMTLFPMWSSSPMQDTLNLDDFLGDLLNDDTNANKVKQALSTPQALCRKIAKQLEKDYEEMHCWDEDGMLNIHRAVMDDQFQEVQRLLVVLQASKIDIDVLTDSGMTSLELAIKFGASKDIVELLLKAGAQPMIPELLHETAVLLASKQSSPLLPYLLSYVSKPKLLDRVDSTGFAPLHYCAYNGYLDGVNALIEKGADVNLKDNRSGRTPFFHALENKHGVVAQKLLENGAIADLPNFSGQSVLSLVDQSKDLYLKTSTIRSQRIA